MTIIDRKKKEALILAYAFRLKSKGITFQFKDLKNKLNTFETIEINDYMVKMLTKDNKEIITSLNDLGIKAKMSKLSIIMNEIKMRFPSDVIQYNPENQLFTIKREKQDDIILKLTRNENSYHLQKITNDEDTSIEKGKQYTFSNGKPSSKLFVNEETEEQKM